MAQRFTQAALSDLTGAPNSYVDADGKVQTFQKVEVPFNYKRGNPGPLDKSSMWTELSAAEAYASGDSTAYVGQLLAVAEGDTVNAYVIENEAGALKKLATGGDADELAEKLAQLSGRLLSSDGIVDQLSGAISLSVANLTAGLSVELEASAGTGDVLSVYTLTQGGEEVGTIEIPKDKVIEEASVVKFDTDEAAREATGNPDAKAGTYLKFKIQNQEKAIYVPVPELVNTYRGYNSDTIKLDVVHESGEEYTISAVVNTRSVGAEHLTEELSGYIEDTFGGLRTDVDQVSSDLEAEITRAKADEQIISAALTSEITRAKADEQIISAALTAEATARTDADSALQGSIDDEATTARAAEQANATAIQNEVTRALSAEGQLRTDLTQEASDRSTADAELQGNIDAEATARSNADSALQGNIDAEATARSNADSALQGNIDAEATARSNADTVLGGKIDSLSIDLNTRIGAEEARAKADEQVISAALTAETAARTAKDEALSGEISSLRDYADSTFETLTAAAGEHKELSDALTAETARAKTDEQVISAALDAETARAKADEQVISAAFDTAVAEFEQAIGDLDDKIELSVSNLSDEIYGGFVKYSDVSGGKSAVTTDNPIATLRDVVGLSGVVHFRGASETFDGKTAKPSDVEWYQTHDPVAGDIVINTTTSVEYLYDGTNWREMGSEGVWAKQADLDLSVSNLELADSDILTALAAEAESREDADEGLSGEISAETERAEAAEAVLCAAVDSKVKVQKVGGTAVSTDLSVVELSEEDYMAKVAAGEDLVADGVMYVMKPEGGYAFNAYDQRIVGVATPSADADAANKKYVDDEVANAALTAIELNGLGFTIAGNKATLEISAINCGTASSAV